ncbi:hypothetical protein BJV85_001935 [Clostridium acetobutylicum]|uniref:hypothetical protein n=1 Tax=Clostridium acetobutylicum TaxID=1488 RepID=UPI001F4C1240|nr:hypothetical protein [Clostridium acetobutylicum]NSA93089.1 hypothetical protein [Clostridium acetobutylicum]
MNKKIKTTDTNINIDESTILVVEIGVLSFEVDERYPWIDVYFIGNESKEFITQIDEEKMPIFVKHEELKRFALNWYFNNVEIVKEIKQTAPEVKSQEQLEENFSSRYRRKNYMMVVLNVGLRTINHIIVVMINALDTNYLI